mgnify:CR=1 FL=1
MLIKGVLASLALLGIYFLLVGLISGFGFAWEQFGRYWYFILGLSAGFGIQISLYSRLREIVDEKTNRGVVAVSGTTSTLAMISCCSHYLVNVLPFVGAAGVLTLVSQYQIQFFWVGLTANLLGIIYLVSRLRKVRMT